MKIRIPIFTREPITGPISFLSKDSWRSPEAGGAALKADNHSAQDACC
jgi:hypothetical protein